MMQLGLFALPQASAVVAMEEPWFSDDMTERAAWVRSSAAFWQGKHDASGLEYSQESIYAAELLRMAADMDIDAEYYRAKPVTLSDIRWFRQKGGHA